MDAAQIHAHLMDYQIAMNGGVRPERPKMPQVDSYNTDGPVAAIRITQGVPTPQGAVDGRIDTDVWGPGVASTWFTGMVDTLLLGCATPTGPGSCEVRFSFVVRATGDVEATTQLGRRSSTRSTCGPRRTWRCGRPRPTSPSRHSPTATVRPCSTAAGVSSSTPKGSTELGSRGFRQQFH